MRFSTKRFMLAGAAVGVGLLIAGAYVRYSGTWLQPGRGNATAATEAKAQEAGPGRGSVAAVASDSVELSDSQLASVKVEPVGEYEFLIEKTAVGSIDFNQDMTVQVFTPYQGRIVELFAKVGDEVKKGQTLFTIDSPDLLQAESTLIAAAGVLQLTNRALARLTELRKSL